MSRAGMSKDMTDLTYSAKLGGQLRTRRRLLALTQTEVADLAGTTQRTVSQVEAGRAAGLELYITIADVLGLQLTLETREQQQLVNPGTTERAS